MFALGFDRVLCGLESPHDGGFAVEQFVDPEDVPDALVHFRQRQVAVVVRVELQEQRVALFELGTGFIRR
jgi:hypothetical protein